jgi:hypothetical protein
MGSKITKLATLTLLAALLVLSAIPILTFLYRPLEELRWGDHVNFEAFMPTPLTLLFIMALTVIPFGFMQMAISFVKVKDDSRRWAMALFVCICGIAASFTANLLTIWS